MRIHRRQLAGAVLFSVATLGMAAPARAQLGIGARLAWVKADTDTEVDVDVDAVRFTGGQIRLGMSPRIGVEVSMDFHTEEFELLNEKVKERPIQASLLLKLATGNVQPYLLGGPGWYKRSVEPLEGPNDDLEVSTTDFGWHAGGGLEVLFGRHFGLHGDYRYTFLDFGDDDDIGGGLIPGLGSVLPGHRGSMWTLGATVYF
jgi:opacity protein-like surface antigen